MLQDAKKFNKLPVFYSYIIAFEARSQWGLKDCDVGTPSHCQRGSEFIRQKRAFLVERYAYQAKHIAEYLGRDGRCVFLIEPDF